MDYDLLAIGSGPAGQKAAIQAAKLGKKVALVERDSDLGGACVNTGTLPSKTLKDVIYYLHGFRQRAFAGVSQTVRKDVTFRELMQRKDVVLAHERDVIRDQLTRNDVALLRGSAAFEDAHTLRITDAYGAVERVSAAHIVIGTGSRPRRPDNIPFDDLVVCDSDSVLTAETMPRTLVVMGGGVIGCEYASMFAAFGIKVTLLDRRADLLRFVDQEVVHSLVYHMRSQGVTFRVGEEPVTVECEPGKGVTIRLKSGKVLQSDMLLFTMGRTANTDRLNLEAAGIATDKIGQITVNEHYQTTVPHIYAAGDVIGFPALAATSMEQGRLAACHAFGVPQSALPKIFPYGIYTVPEISSVGKSEEELTTEGVAYEVGRAYYREIARGQIVGDTHGLLKLIFERETLKLLGVHIIGEGATELVHIGQAVLTFGGGVDFFVHNVFNFPTLAECYRTAAFDGLNRMGRDWGGKQ